MAALIQFRRGTAALWTSANPTLSEGELGYETDTKLYKIGDGSLEWNSLGYSTLREVDQATVVEMLDQATPSAPSAGTLNFFAKSLSGRMLPRVQGPSGLVTPLQPSFFQNNIVLINCGGTTALTALGCAVTSVGTISHPVVTEAYGHMANFVSAASLNATCGTGTSLVMFVRGSLSGSNGFFFSSRLAFPDSSYESSGATTGSRIFVGLTDQVMSASVTSDTPAGNFCGFFRRANGSGVTDTNWKFVTRDGTATQNLVDTGLVFTAQKVYDFYMFCPPQGTVVYWRIDNVTDETTFEGSTSLVLPLNTTFMRAGFQLATINAIARNARMQRIYVESDR